MNRPKISKEEREFVYNLCGGRCAYCGCEITKKNMQIDHIVPFEFADGLKSNGYNANSIDNYLPSCRSCNNYKHTLTIPKFRKAIFRWHEVLMRDSVTYRNAVRFEQVKPNQHKPEFYFEIIGLEPNALRWMDGMFYKEE